MTSETIIREFNRQRRANSDRWITFSAELDSGDVVRFKSFNTWIQIAHIVKRGTFEPARKDVGPMDATVKAMNAFLANFISGADR